jgi:hypothetical protein
MQPLAVGCLGRVRVRARVHESVAVRGSAAEETAFDLGLGGHGGADPDLDPVPFALAHAAEHGHDQVVGFVVRVDGSADLGHPQRDAVMLEQRERQPVLFAVEGAMRLSDYDCVEAAVGVL